MMNDIRTFSGPNAAYYIDLYDQYVRDPASVDAAVRAEFDRLIAPPAPEAAPATGLAQAPAAAPVAPPAAAPTPVPTGCAPGSPEIGSRLASCSLFMLM